jgi:hypothetical protein
MLLRRITLLAVLATLAAGCSKKPYDVAPVSGQVTLDGQPVPRVSVMFQPVATPGNYNPGPGSYGITDENGRYTLKLIGKETPGAVIGKHKVRFDPYTDPGNTKIDRPQPRPKTAIQIPIKYNRQDALLEFDVPASGTDSANFPLTSK